MNRPAKRRVAGVLASAALVSAGCGSDNEMVSGSEEPTWTTAVADTLTTASEARLVGPDSVTVGEPVTLKGDGFPPQKRLTFVVDPTKLHRFQGVGVLIKDHPRTGADGRFTTTFRFPRTYCTGAPRCIEKPFTSGMKVTLVVARFPANDLKFTVAE